MSCHRPFCRITSLAAFAVAAFVLLTPAQILRARAQTAQAGQPATLTDIRVPTLPSSIAVKAAKTRRK